LFTLQTVCNKMRNKLLWLLTVCAGWLREGCEQQPIFIFGQATTYLRQGTTVRMRYTRRKHT